MYTNMKLALTLCCLKTAAFSYSHRTHSYFTIVYAQHTDIKGNSISTPVHLKKYTSRNIKEL